MKKHYLKQLHEIKEKIQILEDNCGRLFLGGILFEGILLKLSYKMQEWAQKIQNEDMEETQVFMNEVKELKNDRK